MQVRVQACCQDKLHHGCALSTIFQITFDLKVDLLLLTGGKRVEVILDITVDAGESVRAYMRVNEQPRRSA